MSENETKFSWLYIFKSLLNKICELDEDNDKAARKLYEYYMKLPKVNRNYNFENYKKMDPLTYIACVSRWKETINQAKNDFNIELPDATDKTGIPTFENQSHEWVFTKAIFKTKMRNEADEIFDNIWKFSRQLEKGSIKEELFNNIKQYEGVYVTNLSKIMFICKPDDYYSCDEKMTAKMEVSENLSDYNSFMAFQKKCKETYTEKPYELSYIANKEINEKKEAEKNTDPYKWKIKDWINKDFWRIVAIAIYRNNPHGSYKAEDIKNLKFYKDIENDFGLKGKQVNHALNEHSDASGKTKYIYTKNTVDNSYKLTQDGIKKVEKWENDLVSLQKQKLTTDEHSKDNNKEDIANNMGKPSDYNPPLNQILYGPPGTGKTYKTVVEAVKILDKDLYNEYKSGQKAYSDLKIRFDNLKEERRIEFITFHQSYSYEEFVEGIKPNIDNEMWNEPIDKLTYKGTNGIFKNISNKAIFERIEINSKLQDTILNFKQLKDKFINENPVGSTFVTNIKNTEFIINNYTNNSVRITPLKGNSTYYITFKYLEEAYNKSLKTQSEIAEIKGVSSGLSYYYFAIYEKLTELKNTKDNTTSIKGFDNINDDEKLQLVKDFYDGKIKLKNDDKNEPYVLIIDEINRGNISKIFGELITLIEEDKRENLTVTLPYSKEKFTVPKNLYIIGTMNTSDRSIASVDIALRRRFKFIEMMPNPELLKDCGDIKDINTEKLLTILNKRICALLDRDHQIGHSYFLNWKKYDLETLKKVWYNSIMPLLNEYFYNDWEKLQAILGEAKGENSNTFIKEISIKDFFATDTNPCDENYYYDFRNPNEENFDFYEALCHAKLVNSKSVETSKIGN